MNVLKISLALIVFVVLNTGFAQPINDNCADPISLNVGLTCDPVTFSNIDATSESISPAPSCGFYLGTDVWFTFMVPGSGAFRIETTALSSGSAAYQLYSGTCSDFTPVQCSGGNTTFNHPELANQTVYLRLFRFNSAAGLDFTLCIWEPLIPANDFCSNAIALPVSNDCNPQNFSCIYTTNDGVGTAPSPTCGFYDGGDVWFTFIVPNSGNFRIEAEALSSGTASYQLYSGTCGTFTAVSCADVSSNFNLPLFAGETLYLRVFRFANRLGLDFSICIYEFESLSNDNCADATTLNVGESCVMQTFNSFYQTTESGIAPGPACIGYTSGDVWFKFIMPASGKVRVERNNISGINAQFALYTGTCGSFTNLACAQLTNSLNVNQPSLGGQEIYMRVYNYGSNQGGEFEICVWEPPTPDNDMCADAIHLPVGLYCQMQMFSNAYCTTEPGIAPSPNCIGYVGGDIWFTFTMPESGQIRIERNNLIDVNAQWAVYEGTCGAMTNVACAQLVNQLNINQPSLGGETLYLRVYNYGSVQGGTFEICIHETAIPVNDMCANAIALPLNQSCEMGQYTNANCTAEAGINPSTNCLGYSGGDVWFTVEVPASGRLRFEINSVYEVNAQMALYQGDCAGFTEVACAQLTDLMIVQDSSLAGETLYLRVFNYGSAQGGVFDLCVAEADCNGDADGAAYFDGCGTCVGGNTELDPCEQDCNGVFGGTAYLDNCDECVGGNTGELPCETDCNGDFGGTAFFDNCNVCVGGNTGLVACAADCNGDFGGAAFTDGCGDCVGGNTGELPCEADPISCTDGIDNDGNGLIDCDDPACQLILSNLGCGTCFNDGLSFADVVLEYQNNCVNNVSTDPEQALGVPNYSGTPQTHVSLGRGFIKLGFTNNTLINSGSADPDLFVFEVGPLVESSSIELRPANSETETILIQIGLTDVDNDGYYEFGSIGGAIASVDIDAFLPGLSANSVQFDAIKIVDAPGSCATSTPGADIDAVCALSSLDCSVGQPCDDGNENTENDLYNVNCECIGTPIFDCEELEANNGDACALGEGVGMVIDCECLLADCNGDFGGTAFLDNCNTCVGGNTALEPCLADCNGDFGGNAFVDNCDECVGGSTGLLACEADCNGDFGGTAYLDDCAICVGGNTGLEPCDEVAPPVNNDCANATPITPVSPNVNYGMGLYAQANSIGTVWGATASGTGSCGAGNDVFYSLNVPYLNHYIVSVNPFGGADVALEILDACGGSQLSCTNAAGAAGLETAYLISLAAGDYTIRVSGSAASSSVGQFLLNVQAAPTTRIMDGTGCNESDLQLEDVIRCNLVSTALDYEWRFVEVGGGLDASFMRSSLSNAGSTNNRNLRLSWVPGIDYNKLYNVYVRAQFDIPGYGVVWGAYREFATDLTMLGASECTVETGTSVTPTQLRPEYSPNNPVSGLPHTFCNGLVATWVGQAEQFQWELDGPTFHEVTSPSYFVNLGSIAGLQAGQVYQVRVRARVNGLWGSYGVQLPVSIGLPSNTQVLGYLCGTTRALNQAIAAVNTCGASSYTFRFQHATEAERIIVRPAYTCPLWLVTPALTPGETYSVTVKVAQGGVDGDYSTACDITIAGPQAEGLADDMMVSKVTTEGGMGIYPNPNTGSEVRVELNGIEDGAHNVEVTIYDIYGKLMTRDVFGHQGSQLSRLVRFETELATGMYLVHVTIDGEIFATEKLIVK
jgi:hypothetical protein